MDEQHADVGRNITLCYETFGDPSSPPLLLIMGLGTQMVAWHEDFCRRLVDDGFFVIRFDNRDVGRSTHLVAAAPPTPGQLLRRKVRPAYTLDDMADDAAGLLDALDLPAAHVVGASMGGMIAQQLAARHPDRVLSLASIMSTTGGRRVGQPALKMYPVLLRRPPVDRDGYIASSEKVFAAIGSPGFAQDLEALRTMAGLSFDRRGDAAGPGRQLAAIIGSGDRTADLRRITAPTVVIHGRADRLVRPSGAQATADAIPGAELVLIDGMGHDLPRDAWPQIVAAIERNAARAARATAA